MSDAATPRQPFPGLRPFRTEETDLFFGREECVNKLVDLLAAKHFLAVLGPSGSGKSSLVRTGLIDALELGLMVQAGSRWRIIDFRPGGQPMANLAGALLKSENNSSPEDAALLRSFLIRGPRSVIEWCRDGHLESGENLLLLVDQFEELFRYQEYAGREEAEAFVALLIESSLHKELPIYVTITMRSEFLGACALIERLAERMNECQFLTPRMTREQCRSAIEGPAAVCGIEIEPALVNRLLNDMANFAPWEGDAGESMTQLDRLARRADQLPLLQHALNRMWLHSCRSVEGQSESSISLRLADYETVGGIQGALDRHADDVYGALPQESQILAKTIFRSLTSGSTIADAVRRQTSFGDLVRICGNKEAEVREVIEAFRAPGRNFLLPEEDVPLTPDKMIDISHESLIRQWRQLSTWLEEEAQDAQQLRRLIDAADLARRKKGGLVHGLNLQTLLEWRNTSQPNEEWARRYGSKAEFAEAMSFLERSEAAERAEHAERQRRQEADLAQRRRRQVVMGGATLLVATAAGGVVYGFQYIQQEAQRRLEEEKKRQEEEKLRFVEGKRRELDNEVRKEVEKTLPIRIPSKEDVKRVFDFASRYLSLPFVGKPITYDEACTEIIGIFQEVYSNRPDRTNPKPFLVFDTIALHLDKPSMWSYIIVTLGEVGISLSQQQLLELALLAFQQQQETASKKDKTLVQFKKEFVQSVSAIKEALGGSPDVPGRIKCFDHFLTVLRLIDQRPPRDIEVRERIAELLTDKGDTYADFKRTTEAVYWYRQAIEQYNSINRTDYVREIETLREKIRNPIGNR